MAASTADKLEAGSFKQDGRGCSCAKKDASKEDMSCGSKRYGSKKDMMYGKRYASKEDMMNAKKKDMMYGNKKDGSKKSVWAKGFGMADAEAGLTI